MLVKCPECGKDISDKALMCPNCGFSASNSNTTTYPAKNKYKAKKMRLPNGFGRITKLKNSKLRKPYRAMVTVGTTSTGRPIGKLLRPEAYFKTYNEAYMALMEYHKNPFDLNIDMTVEEVYGKWSAKHFTLISDARAKGIASTWAYCDSVKKLSIRQLRAIHIKRIIDDGVKIDKDGGVHPIPNGMKYNVKSLFVGILDYALERELVDRNFAKTISIGREVSKEIEESRTPHIPYTDEELSVLWANIDRYNLIKPLLIQCYSGWRPGELSSINIADVDISNWTFKGGNKTENGRNRVVPIHSKIQGIVKEMYDEAQKLGRKHLIFFRNTNGKTKDLTLRSYDINLRKLTMELSLNESHRPHDGRVTFVTLAKNSDVDEYAIKRIVGHSITDITEKTYTVRSIDWLRDEIEKIR